MMIYTGGTTGQTKRCRLSIEAVNWNALNTIVSWGLTEEDTNDKLYASIPYRRAQCAQHSDSDGGRKGYRWQYI